jgi:uncharacterized protein (DUF1684 family)
VLCRYSSFMRFFSAALVGVITFGVAVAALAPDASYLAKMAKFRKDYEADLLKDEGWLSVAGLFWLEPGDNSVGSSPSAKVVLPANASPAQVGVLTLKDGKVIFSAKADPQALVNGKPAETAELKSDASGAPDRVSVGSVSFKIIERGKRIGVRLYDSQAPSRTRFTGVKWFPVRPEYVVHAKFVPYNPPKMLPILNVLGDTRMAPSPGYLLFTFKGKRCRLDTEGEDNGLFLNFQDATTGKTTYGAGRFLDTPKPVNGLVEVDFNQATNPPCAFTTFATCPLPPKGNRLPVAIEAGERAYHG